MRAEPQPLLVQPVRDVPTLDALRPEWEELWRACRAPVFCAPAWLRPWWDHVGQGQLAGIALRAPADGLLVGFAPLYLHRADDGARQLLPLGIATSDRVDALLRPGWEQAAGAALVQALAREAPAWDRLDAPDLAPGATLAALPWPAHWAVDAGPGAANPVLDLPARLPPAMAQALGYARRRAARDADPAVERAADEDTARGLLAELDRLHAARWAQRGEGGVLGGDGVLPWLHAAVPGLLQAGLLRLLGLRLQGATAAVLLCLADPPGWPQRRWSYWIGGFDPAQAAFSPGTLLVGAAIDAATAEGAQAFDFLRGDEPYKRRWGAQVQRLARLRVRPP